MIAVNSVKTGPLRASIQLQLALWGHHNADMALSENEFDIPDIKAVVVNFSYGCLD